MRGPFEKSERFYLRWLLVLIGGGLLLALVGAAGLYAFHRWQEGHLIRRAAAVLSGGDVKTASLTARRALQINPDNVEAARLLAQIGERAGDGSELIWRRKVLALRPNSTEDALALVRTALRANDLATAEHTLDAMSSSAQQLPAYHAARGRLAEMRQRRAEAEEHWTKAATLAPEEGSYQVQLAMLQVMSDDEAKRSSAVATLERLRGDPKYRTAATRALIMHGAARGGDAQT